MNNKQINIAVLYKVGDGKFPLEWADLKYYPNSIGHKIEVYLNNDDDLLAGLIFMFYDFFGFIKNDIKIYNAFWWDYCLDTWDIHNDTYNYKSGDLSVETSDYLNMLEQSGIEQGYSGVCGCTDWDKFLSIALPCVINHKAPYSPIFFDEDNNLFFYFHHTGSFGLHYKSHNEAVEKILAMIKDEYYSN